MYQTIFIHPVFVQFQKLEHSEGIHVQTLFFICLVLTVQYMVIGFTTQKTICSQFQI